MGALIRVLIADDHPVVRDGLRRILEIESDIEIIGEAATGAEAITLAERLRPEVLLLDLMMPGVSGLQALRESHADMVARNFRILVLTAVADRQQLIEAVRMQVHGIISKDEPIDRLLKAVRTVAAGQYWINRELLAEAVRPKEQRRMKF
jgi:DNA-binding NarL/FixJ family response regulator